MSEESRYFPGLLARIDVLLRLKLRMNLMAAMQGNVPQYTVHRTLLSTAVRNGSSILMSKLYVIRCRNHMLWARSHCHWITEQWKRAALINDSCFYLNHLDGLIHAPRLPRDIFLLECVDGRKQTVGGSGMMETTFSWNEFGTFVIVQGNLNASTYVNITYIY